MKLMEVPLDLRANKNIQPALYMKSLGVLLDLWLAISSSQCGISQMNTETSELTIMPENLGMKYNSEYGLILSFVSLGIHPYLSITGVNTSDFSFTVLM